MPILVKFPSSAEPISTFGRISGPMSRSINGLMHIILKKGWQNQAFVDERTENVEELRKVIEHYAPERVAEITGIQ